MYLPMVGVAVAVGGVLSRGTALSVRVAVAGVLTVLGAACIVQAGYWENELKLWRHAVAANPKGFMAHYSLASAEAREGMIDQAISHDKQSIELNPLYAEPYEALGKIALSKGDIDQAMDYFRKYIECAERWPATDYSSFASYRNALGKQLLNRGRVIEAIEQFETALRRAPQGQRQELEENLAKARAKLPPTAPTTAPATREGRP